MPRPLPRHVAVALCLLPVLWLAVRWTEFKTEVTIEGSEAGIRLLANGQILDGPLQVGHLRAFYVDTAGSFFPMGGGNLTIEGPAGTEPERFKLPRYFEVPESKIPRTSDWWVDSQTRPAEVFRGTVSVPMPWRLRATLFGRGQASIRIRLTGDTHVTCGFRAGSLNNDIFLLGPNGETVVATAMEAHPAVDLRHTLHWIVAGLFLAALLIVVFSGTAWLTRRHPWKVPSSAPWSLLMFFVLALDAGISFWVAGWVLDARPHFQDDLGYLLRAKWLLAGHIVQPLPELSEHFTIPFTHFISGRWISQYPIGWPALLALGESFQRAWIVAPLCGVLGVYFTWRLGSELAGKSVGFCAALLQTLSPLAQILSGSMLSHAATSMWITLFLWLYVRGWRRKENWRSLAWAGVALGFAFSTRPLAGFAVGVPAGIFALVEFYRRRFGSDAWRSFGALVAGGLMGSLPVFVDNWRVTGNPFVFAYSFSLGTQWSLGQWPSGLFWLDRTLAAMPPVAFGWGWPWIAAWFPILGLTFAFAFVPFLSGRANRYDWLLLGVVVVVPLSYIGYTGGTPMHGFGPRYYADVFCALFVLTARGFQALGKTPAPEHGTNPSSAARGLAILLFAVLTASTASSLVRRLELYRGYNNVDDRIERAITSAGVTHGLILLGEPAYLNWVRAARMLPVDLRARLVFAQDRGDNRALLLSYRGWPVYFVDDRGLRTYVPSP